MKESEQRAAARQFAADWQNRGDEKQDTQTFWLTLLQRVYGVEAPEDFIAFELPVRLDHTSFIDGYIQATGVLIEQKGRGVDLHKGIRQSDGTVLTPYGQARRYAGYLPHDKNPRWIVVCNFEQFQVHDMNRPNDEPETILLADLEKEWHRLKFLVDTGSESVKKEMRLSLQAGEIVGALYDALLEQYNDPQAPETLKSLNALCVRLVFCLYAEDAGIFGRRGMFHDYLRGFAVKDVRQALLSLFKVLDTKPEERDPYIDEALAAFPYVNGGLFSDESVVIPRLNEKIVDLILCRASEDFDWSEISPTIFGAVFESTLNPETRRSGGMHYTSIENIHKVIDPLFLDELKAELEEIKQIDVKRTRNARARALQFRFAELIFLDPACGSGNFLTETYLSLRRLENEIISILHEGQLVFDTGDLIKVSIGQFYGIEINDFAVTVAKTALWIAESQMLRATETVVSMDLDFLPLKSYANIVEGNALRLDWAKVVPKEKLSYIMGNPPFVGLALRTGEQQQDMASVFSKNERAGRLDYVAAWYKRAAEFITGTDTEAAFVSTNSIVQGEQVPILWNDILNDCRMVINFAYRSFVWNNEAKDKAAVHCVIIGFAGKARKKKILYEGNIPREVDKINGYLVNADNVFLQLRGKPLSDRPKLVQGNKPWDGGYLILTPEERQKMLDEYPHAQKLIRPYVGSYEFINRKERYCLWLKDVAPNEYRSIPEIRKRLEGVAEIRRKTKTKAVQEQVEIPMLFSQIRQPESDYILVPETSSASRRYIPMGFMDKHIIASNSTLVASDATIYCFGILMSNVHMAWTRTVCGRLKSDYRYSPSVYNNFPWPAPTKQQKARIEQTAQAILDARALYPAASLADLYDELTMPPELRKAHQDNDRAVMDAYGFTKGTPARTSESACVAELMKMYQQLAKTG